MNVFYCFISYLTLYTILKNKPKIIQANKLILKIFMFTPITNYSLLQTNNQKDLEE